MAEWLMYRSEGPHTTIITASEAVAHVWNPMVTPIRVVEDPDGDHLGYFRSPECQVVPREGEPPEMIRPKEAFGEQWPYGYGHVEPMGYGRIAALRVEEAMGR